MNAQSLFGFCRPATWLLRLFVALALLAVGAYAWAYLSTDTSLAARGILWGDSDAGDLARFPARVMHADSSPLQFTPPKKTTQGMLAALPITNDEVGAVNMPLEEYLALTNTKAFIVLHNDQLLYEAYFNGADRQTSVMSFSASKAFVSTLVAIAVEEGYIADLDVPVTAFIPELLDQDIRFGRITIRHLLSMKSGLRWERDESNPFSDDFISYYSPDLRDVAVTREIVELPGQRFVYNDYNPLLLGMVLERATGMSISEFMESRLWQPMGAEGDGSWSLDSDRSGFEKTFAGLNGRAIDLVKLGWLFLNNGENGDVQVVPQWWINEIASGPPEAGARYSYQYYWWIDHDRQMYFAEGDKCQFIDVFPQAELVIARFGTDCGGTGFSDLIPNIAAWIETEMDQSE